MHEVRDMEREAKRFNDAIEEAVEPDPNVYLVVWESDLLSDLQSTRVWAYSETDARRVARIAFKTLTHIVGVAED